MVCCAFSWLRHQMETFSALLAICAGNSPFRGEFPAQRPVTRSFDVFFDLRPNKRLSKQWRGWWFGTQSRSLWRHRNVVFWSRRIFVPQHCLSGPIRVHPGPPFEVDTVVLGFGIPTMKIILSRSRIIFMMGMHILSRRHVYTKTALKGPLNNNNLNIWTESVLLNVKHQRLYNESFNLWNLCYYWLKHLSKCKIVILTQATGEPIGVSSAYLRSCGDLLIRNIVFTYPQTVISDGVPSCGEGGYRILHYLFSSMPHTFAN